MFVWITKVITTLGYVGVAALTFLENLFPPIPSELVIPLAGFVAATGALRLELVIAAGSAGSLAGALLWYGIGRRVGERRLRAWVDRHGKSTLGNSTGGRRWRATDFAHCCQANHLLPIPSRRSIPVTRCKTRQIDRAASRLRHSSLDLPPVIRHG